jgi:hypothetical protein
MRRASSRVGNLLLIADPALLRQKARAAKSVGVRIQFHPRQMRPAIAFCDEAGV